MMFRMAQKLNKDNNDLLWLWIVGLTEQYIHSKISKVHYDECVEEIQGEVARLTNANTIISSSAPSTYSQGLQSQSNYKEGDEKPTNKTVHRDIGTIMSEQE